MAIVISVEAQNAMLAGFKTAIGPGAILRLYAGPLLLATVTFAGEWLTTPANGRMMLAGTPASNPAANESGVPNIGRFFKADGSTLVAEADVSDMAGQGAIRLSNPVITKSEAVVMMQLVFAMPGGA